VNVDELAGFLDERGYRFEYDYEAREPLHATAWCRWWVWCIDNGELTAWGRDPDIETMVAHILTMPPVHPEKPMDERIRDFGIEPRPFDPDGGQDS
jgi:hypothetical protein